MNSSLCLVTGVAGFVGSHLAEQLIRNGHRVIGLDGFTDYYSRSVKEGNLARLRGDKRFTFVESDLLDVDLETLLRGEITEHLFGAGGVEQVFHLAGQPGVRASWGTSFDEYTRNNILATQRLLEAARTASIRKLVYASSSSIYGDAEAFPTPEDTIPRPVSPYGVSKLAGEHLCLLYARNYRVPAVCLRYFTVYGPRQRPDMAFHRFIRATLEGRAISVYGNGEQTRDFTFVGDAVEGTIRAGFGEAVREVFNIGGGSRVTVNTVLELLELISGQRIERRYVDPQKGDVKDTGADITKAGALLGYRPSTSLAEGLAKQVACLRQTERGAVPGTYEH